MKNCWMRSSNLLVRRLFKIVFSLLLLAGMVSCATPAYWANRFVIDETDIHVLLLPPAQLMKSYAPEHPDSIPADSITGPEDSRARFIQAVDDSLFIDRFFTAAEDYLDELLVNVYGPEDMDAFFDLDKPGYIFHMAQAELLEYADTEVLIGDTPEKRYRGTVNITVMEHNVWFEFQKLHDPDFDMQVLFSTYATSDYVDGRFVLLNSGEARLDPRIYRLAEQDIYDLAYFSGEQNAQNIFDHIMNLYVAQNMSGEPSYRFHYDMEEHVIVEKEEPPFILIEPAGEDQGSE